MHNLTHRGPQGGAVPWRVASSAGHGPVRRVQALLGYRNRNRSGQVIGVAVVQDSLRHVCGSWRPTFTTPTAKVTQSSPIGCAGSRRITRRPGEQGKRMLTQRLGQEAVAPSPRPIVRVALSGSLALVVTG